MRIAQASSDGLQSQLLHRQRSPSPSPSRPLLHYQVPVLSLRRVPLPSSFASTTCSLRLSRRGHTSVRISPSIIPNTSLTSSPKPLSTTHSLANDGASVLIQKKAIGISPALKGTSIFLIGINSVMKTSVGKLLADALRYYYFDSDILVEEAAGGESDGKSFKERDKEGFCESETEVLKQLSSMGRLVVCAGNGAVQSTTNLALLRHGLSIWIDVPLEMIAKDVIENGWQLPSSEIVGSGSYSEVVDQLTVLYEEMRGGYATADATVSLQNVASHLGYDELGAVTKGDMSLEVLKEIEKLMRVKKMLEEAARPF